MTTYIPRHSFPTGSAEEGLAVLQKNALPLIDGLEADSTDLGDALRLTVTLAKSHCLLDTEGSHLPTWESWVNAMQVGSATFAAATTAEEHVLCRIADKDRTLHATGPQRYVNPESWLTALYLAVVCREKRRVKALCQVPLSLLRESGAQSTEFDYAWIDVLQTYWNGGTDLIPKLRAAIDATGPETVTHLVYPPMELFHRFIRGDHAGFNRALVDALEWHKRYWSQESRAVRASGLIALAPLAMACLAYDTGTPIEVQSDYLPIALLERDWCGEFPT